MFMDQTHWWNEARATGSRDYEERGRNQLIVKDRTNNIIMVKLG